MPKVRGSRALVTTFDSRSFWKNWKIVKPKLMRDSEVRMTT
jgi:hypothetical protein